MTDEGAAFRAKERADRNPSQRNREPGPRVGTTRRVGGSIKKPGSNVKPPAGRHPVTGRYQKAPQQASVAKGKPGEPEYDQGGGYGGPTHPSAGSR